MRRRQGVVDCVFLAVSSLTTAHEQGCVLLSIPFKSPQTPSRVDEVRTSHDGLEERFRVTFEGDFVRLGPGVLSGVSRTNHRSVEVPSELIHHLVVGVNTLRVIESAQGTPTASD